MVQIKKTILGAAIATAMLSTSAANAYMIGESNDANVEVYGVVSISAVDYGADGANGEPADGFVLENESRVGFRAAKTMNEHMEAFVQMESGWMLDTGAAIGNRDTFVGIRGDEWGAVRFGRMLTPMYELVDWPYSASNLGRTFDRGWMSGERFNFDRKSQMGRYDSPMFSDAVRFSLAGGNGSSNSKDSNFFGGSVSYTPISALRLHAAFETATDTVFASGSDASHDDSGNYVPATRDSIGDTSAYFLAAEWDIVDNFNIKAAYKSSDYEANTQGHVAYTERSADAYSVQANYFFGNSNIRVGYADQQGKDNAGTGDEIDSTSITGEYGYSFNTVYTFLRLTQQTDNKYDGDLAIRIGTEWTF
jgi:predicted porin